MHRIHHTLRFVIYWICNSTQLITVACVRLEAAPEFLPAQWPTGKKMPSTKNTPIESFWRWQRNGEGHNIRQAIQAGSQAGIFMPQEPLHR